VKTRQPQQVSWNDLERLFDRVKQINGIDNDKYWSKRPPWKPLKYDRNKKSYEALRKAEMALCCFAQ